MRNIGLLWAGAALALGMGPGIASGLSPADAGDHSVAKTEKKSEEAGGTISFPRDVMPVLRKSCAVKGCHVAPKPKVGVNLLPGQAYDNLVSRPSVQSDLPRVTPGKVEQSYLWYKLQGTQEQVGKGKQMPPTARLALTDEEMELLRRWIEQGAPKR